MYNNDFKMDGVKHTEFLTAAQQHSEFLTAQQHTLLSGMASYDGGRNFLFCPMSLWQACCHDSDAMASLSR